MFGFAPGALLRLIVLLYPRDHPRRRELIGELYAYPRIERPFWVAEQLELALAEGLPGHFVSWRIRQPAFVPTVISREDAESVIFVIATLRRAGLTPDEIRWGLSFRSPATGPSDSERLTSRLALLQRRDLHNATVAVALLQSAAITPDEIWDALWPRSKWPSRRSAPAIFLGRRR